MALNPFFLLVQKAALVLDQPVLKLMLMEVAKKFIGLGNMKGKICCKIFGLLSSEITKIIKCHFTVPIGHLRLIGPVDHASLR